MSFRFKATTTNRGLTLNRGLTVFRDNFLFKIIVFRLTFDFNAEFVVFIEDVMECRTAFVGFHSVVRSYNRFDIVIDFTETHSEIIGQSSEVTVTYISQ